MKRIINNKVSLESRRDFLKRSIALGLLTGTGVLFDSRDAFAAGNQVVNSKVLANIFLSGGPDLRHAFVPAFNADVNSFGYMFWKSMAPSQFLKGSVKTDNTSLANRYATDFRAFTSNGVTFGMLNKCGWLQQMFAAGKVALVANTLGSDSRDHDHATKVMDFGNTTIPKTYLGSGWGGRLAYAAKGNVLALSGYPRAFSYGPDPTQPSVLTRFSDQNVIITSNMRDYGLHEAGPNNPEVGNDGRIARGLRGYFEAKRTSVPVSSPYAKFFETEKKLRNFGDQVQARLAAFPQPTDLQTWMEADHWYLGMQLRNLHDALACSDIVNLRVASMEYGGWDTHDNQFVEIEGRLEELFGVGQGLDLLYRNLSQSAQDNLVIVLNGEFGRQIRANADSGTDHGEGNLTIIIGNKVKGGVYGTMFPDSEVAILKQPNKYYSPDIKGLNAIDHVFGRACDWVSPGSKAAVFPTFSTKPVETLLSSQLPGMFI